METKKAIARTSEMLVEGRLVKVQIYTTAGIWTGSVYCPQRRLLDALNLRQANKEFLPVSEVKVRSVDGEEATMQSAYINKANILFVREIESGQTRGLGGQAGHKYYPFVPKCSTAVKVYMPLYTLSGRVHYPKEEQLADVLNSEMRFLPMTEVLIYPSAVSSEAVVASFIAVNKVQILSLGRLGDSLNGE